MDVKGGKVNFGDYFDLPNRGLTNYYARVVAGNDEEYRTTFYKGKSLQSVLKGWKPTLETIRGTWSSLCEFEDDLAKKVGPMSIMKPLSERMEDIESYYEAISLASEAISDSAVAAVVREWDRVRPLSLRGQKRTWELMKKSTNSGSPFFTKRKLVREKTLPARMSVSYPEVHQFLHGDEWLGAAVLGWRGQEGGPTDDDVKQRVVWMFPVGVNLCELQVYQPAIELAQRHELVPAWVGSEAVDRRITQLFDTKGASDDIICTDFSKFDQHFNSDMQLCARKILTAILADKDDSRDWLDNVFPIKYMIPLAYNYGKIKFGMHGMGSGSGGTNFDETLAHRALQYEAAQSAGAMLNPNSMCLGDDGILTYPGINVDDVVKSYSAHGQEMNVDKQYVSAEDCTYLRKWHHRDYRVGGICVGVYSTYRALGRLCEQERYYDPEIWGPEMVALRQLSIIENCKYHPLRDEFAEYCMAGDKYRLGIDIPGFLDNISAHAQEAIDYMPDFLGYTRSQTKVDEAAGIESWWIVNLLKSMR
jgi:hypothetical protein